MSSSLSHLVPRKFVLGCRMWLQCLFLEVIEDAAWVIAFSCVSRGKKKGEEEEKSSARHHIRWVLWLLPVKWLHQNLHGHKDMERESAQPTPCSAVCPLASNPWGEGWLCSSLPPLPHLFSLFVFIPTLWIIETIWLTRHSFICGFLYYSPTSPVSLLSLFKKM